VALSLKELLDWVGEIADLAKATRDMAANHSDSAEFYRDLVTASTWQGQAAQEASISMSATAFTHGGKADDLANAATAMDRAQHNAEVLATEVKRILADAAESPAVEVNASTNEVTPPPNYGNLDAATQKSIANKISALEVRIGDALDEGDRIDQNLAAAIATASGLPVPPRTTNGEVRLVDDEQQIPANDPTVSGPAGTSQHEQDGYDLQDQFQDGQGPIFGGDPRDGVPRSPASQLAQGPPGTRPLPTGTAIGPDGHRYAFFSNPDGTETPGVSPYVTNGSVWDYTNPAHPVKVGDLPNIFQASGVYDPTTNQMVIIGNATNRTGDLTRGLWMSGPIDRAKPNSWIGSLQRVGDVGLAGDRESQLVALKGGGYMLVGATTDGPVQAITAATPQGLIGAAPQTLVDQGQLPSVYGPTVTGTSIDPATGLETVQLRVSTWPPGPVYDPHTWTTTFGVQH